MPMPVRHLPTIQNWDCHQCGDCCRTYAVAVTDDERDRILKQGWMVDPTFGKQEPLKADGKGGYTLSRTADGSCVFLGPDNLCRIHAKFGNAAKPFACRLYPFVLVPHGDHFKVSLRYACPSVASNKGRTCTAHAAEVGTVAALVEANNPVAVSLEPVPLAAGQVVPWADLGRFTKWFGKLVADTTYPIERRLRQVAKLAATLRTLRYENISGGLLNEMLKVLATNAVDETPADPYSVPKPGWVGRTLFRQRAGVHVRQDFGPHAGVGKRGAWARFAAGWRFGVGGGQVPQVHASLPVGVAFAAAEEPAGEVPNEVDELFTRYFQVKLESGQFFGPANFDRPYWEGLDSLLLVFPTVMWAARVMVAGGAERTDATIKALRMADDNFGYSKFLAGPRAAWMVRAMADKGEVAKLIAWYAR